MQIVSLAISKNISDEEVKDGELVGGGVPLNVWFEGGSGLSRRLGRKEELHLIISLLVYQFLFHSDTD